MAEQEPSAADAADRHRTLSACIALALAGHFGASALERIIPATTGEILGWISTAMALVALLLVLPIVAWKLRNLRGGQWPLYRGRDGFVAEAFARAHIISWAATMVLLIPLMSVAYDPGDLPPVLYLEVVAAFMLGVFSLAFFLLNRSDGQAGGRED